MSKYLSFIYFILFSCIMRASTLGQSYQPVAEFGNHEGGITVMTKDLPGRYLIAGDDKGYLYFHNLTDGKLIKSFKAHGAPVRQLQFNSTGKLLISATADGEIKIFDFAADKIIQSIYSPSYSGIRFVLFSIADGFIYFNGNRKLFKTRSDLTQQVEEIMQEEDTITDAVITSDRSALIISTGTILKVINTRTDIVSQELNTGSSKIDRIALVRDSLLATWSIDGTIFFWHYLYGQIDPKPVFFLKAGAPSPIIFSPSSQLMASCNIGNWARIWKPMERKMVQELFVHAKTVTSTCFGTNDNILFTGSLDRKIAMWQYGAPPPEKVVDVETPHVHEDSMPQPLPVLTSKPQVSDDIEMDEENIPKYIAGRKVVSSMRIEMDSPVLKIFVYDNSFLDGDTMSLFFNGVWILDHYGVTKQKKPVELTLAANTNNYLVLFANNMGKSPPNTAAIEFDDGKKKHVFKLSSDLKSCSAINFYYKK